MNVSGIIVEYNPFHYGHLYHIQKTREITKCDLLIAVMSGNFMQRGDVAVVDKWERCQAALNAGVDLVIELPFGYACQSADYFANASVTLLNALHADTIVFGSESNDVESFEMISKALIEHQEEYNQYVHDYMQEGYRYPNACNEALKKITSMSITLPNDLLGYSYVKSIVENNYPIKPISILRTNDFHSEKLDSSIVSAHAIRQALKENKEISSYTPMTIDHYHSLDDYYDLLYYILLMEDIHDLHMVEEGIEHLFKKNILLSHNMDEFISLCTSKRYTSTRIKRTILSILMHHTKEEHKALKLDYIRILGMNEKGKDYIKSIKKDCSLPILSNYKPDFSALLDLELKASQLYYLLEPIEIREEMLKKEYKNHCLMLTNETSKDIMDK